MQNGGAAHSNFPHFEAPVRGFFGRKRRRRVKVSGVKGPQYEIGDINIEYFKWRPILEGIATLNEINSSWNLNDLADANEALDLKEDISTFYQNQAERQAAMDARNPGRK